MPALPSRVTGGRVRRIAARRPVGGIDIFSDGTDLVSRACRRGRLRKLYE